MVALASVAFCFGAAALTSVAGLSAAFGAFLAGLVIAGSTMRAEAIAATHPIQSLLIVVFFLSIGLLIDLDYVIANLGTVIVVVIAVLAAKTCINVFLLRLVRTPWEQAFPGGLIMAQIGEFSFVLAASGLASGAVSRRYLSPRHRGDRDFAAGQPAVDGFAPPLPGHRPSRRHQFPRGAGRGLCQRDRRDRARAAVRHPRARSMPGARVRAARIVWQRRRRAQAPASAGAGARCGNRSSGGRCLRWRRRRCGAAKTPRYRQSSGRRTRNERSFRPARAALPGRSPRWPRRPRPQAPRRRRASRGQYCTRSLKASAPKNSIWWAVFQGEREGFFDQREIHPAGALLPQPGGLQGVALLGPVRLAGREPVAAAASGASPTDRQKNAPDNRLNCRSRGIVKFDGTARGEPVGRSRAVTPSPFRKARARSPS